MSIRIESKFRFRSGRFVSDLDAFGAHLGTILAPFGVRFGSIWGLWRGPVEEKLPSRIEDRWRQVAPPHFKRFWAQKEATRRPKINQKSMKNQCKNQ